MNVTNVYFLFIRDINNSCMTILEKNYRITYAWYYIFQMNPYIYFIET